MTATELALRFPETMYLSLKICINLERVFHHEVHEEHEEKTVGGQHNICIKTLTLQFSVNDPIPL